jgi:hypothetical protein
MTSILIGHVRGTGFLTIVMTMDALSCFRCSRSSANRADDDGFTMALKVYRLDLSHDQRIIQSDNSESRFLTPQRAFYRG